MRFCMATVSLSGDLEGRLRAIAAAGFDGLELSLDDLRLSRAGAARVAALFDELGLEVFLVQPLRDIEGVSPDDFARSRLRVGRALDLMRLVGATTLQVCSNVGTAVSSDPDLAAEQLSRVAELAAQRGCRVAYEAIAWARHVRRWSEAWDIVRRADHPALGLCLDGFHIDAVGDSPAGIAAIPAERIFIAQVSDAADIAGDVLAKSRAHRLHLGEGDGQVLEYLGEVLATGYDDVLSVELFDAAGRHGAPEHSALVGMQTLRLALEDAGAGRAGAGQAAGVTAIHAIELDPRVHAEIVEVAEILGVDGLAALVPGAGAPGERAVSGVVWSAPDPDRLEARALRLPARGPVHRFTGEVGVAGEPAFVAVALGVDTAVLDEAVLVAARVLGLEVSHGPYMVGALASIAPVEARDRSGSPRLLLHPSAWGCCDRIVIRTDDVRGLALRAARAGLRIPIPEGYYDALGAQCGLEELTVSGLRALDLLYDSDREGGEYWQLLVGPIAGRLILEFGEAAGGYCGAGEANGAVVRAATTA